MIVRDDPCDTVHWSPSRDYKSYIYSNLIRCLCQFYIKEQLSWADSCSFLLYIFFTFRQDVKNKKTWHPQSAVKLKVGPGSDEKSSVQSYFQVTHA